MSLLDAKFKYVNAEDSRKPNYLRNKFASINKAIRDAAEKQKKADEEAVRVVTKISKDRR